MRAPDARWTTRDVAEVAALATTGDELSYGAFELRASGMQDGYEITAVPEGAFRDGMTRMMAYYGRHGLPGGNALVVRSILHREPRSLRDYFRKLAAG
jgi:hypothetical protein